MTSTHCRQPDYREAKRITWISVIAHIILGGGKVTAGYFGHSRALIADGLHSFTDLTTDIAVLLGIGYASRPPDATHHYGHYKITTLVSLFISIAILAFCLLLIADSVRAIINQEAVVPSWPTLVIALASVVVKEWLFYRTMQVGHESKSSMVLANAWHHRTDSITSIIAAIGIATVLVLGEGWAFLDAAVGIILGGYIAIEGVKLLLSALKDLIDTAPAQDVIDDIREHILPTPGVLGYHEFRARRIGDMLEVDLHLLVSPELSVKQGHDIAANVKQEILSRHREVLNVLIHVEPATEQHKQERGVAEIR